MVESVGWDAVVLAGGRASRLGGIDKTALVFDGMQLLERALAAVSGARRVAVVGPAELRGRLAASVHLVTESPRFGGPVAAAAAGLERLGPDAAPRVALLAADLLMPAEALGELLAVGSLASRADAVVAADSAGRMQPLLGVYGTAALRRAVAATAPLAGASMRALLGGMLVCQVRLPDSLCADVDTPHDLGLLRPRPEHSYA